MSVPARVVMGLVSQRYPKKGFVEAEASPPWVNFIELSRLFICNGQLFDSAMLLNETILNAKYFG